MNDIYEKRGDAITGPLGLYKPFSKERISQDSFRTLEQAQKARKEKGLQWDEAHIKIIAEQEGWA